MRNYRLTCDETYLISNDLITIFFLFVRSFTHQDTLRLMSFPTLLFKLTANQILFILADKKRSYANKSQNSFINLNFIHLQMFVKLMEGEERKRS